MPGGFRGLLIFASPVFFALVTTREEDRWRAMCELSRQGVPAWRAIKRIAMAGISDGYPSQAAITCIARRIP